MHCPQADRIRPQINRIEIGIGLLQREHENNTLSLRHTEKQIFKYC